MRWTALVSITAALARTLVIGAPETRQAGGLADPYDQRPVAVERQPTRPDVAKVVLVAGRPSHGPGEHEFFAGCAVLKKLLEQTPNVFPVLARDGWPKDPRTLTGAKAVVFFMDGGAAHPVIQDGHPKALQSVIDSGAGFVNLHYAVEYPASVGPRILDWLGGFYETGYSTNPHWKADFKSLPRHPVTRGVEPFSIVDEWYYNIRFRRDRRGVTPILQAVPPDSSRGTPAAREHPGRPEVTAWAFDRASGGRSFGFTGGHFHCNWGDKNFRRLVVNAILWSAGVEVPAEGAPVRLDPTDLKKYLDRKDK